MTASEIYNSKILIESFGKSRVYEVCRHLRGVWPGFPSYSEGVNNYSFAWIIFILSKCKFTRRQDVEKAILEGRELTCEGQEFIIWLGDLLFNPAEISAVRNIFIFYEGDSCVQVTHMNGITKIFQGENRANTIRRAAILSQEFLLELSEMLVPFQDESLDGPEFEFDEDLHPDPTPQKNKK
jgi:hypothetical protein